MSAPLPGWPPVFRAELERLPDGTWDLYYDRALAARSDTTTMTPGAACDWASWKLGCGLSWVNGLGAPDAESGYWVADPEPGAVPGGPS